MNSSTKEEKVYYIIVNMKKLLIVAKARIIGKIKEKRNNRKYSSF